MNLKLFLSTFALIFVSELPDKTALAAFMMAARSRPVHVFIGVAAAFVVQTIVAAVFGTLFGNLLTHWIPLISGILFILFGVSAWRRKEEAKADEERKEVDQKFHSNVTAWKTVSSAFVVIFIAEWGDLTQVATASLIAHYHAPYLISSAAILALWSVTLIAVLAGSKLSGFKNQKLIDRLLGLMMFGIGAYFLIHFFRSGA